MGCFILEVVSGLVLKIRSELEAGFLKAVSNIEIDNYKKETMPVGHIDRDKHSLEKEEPENSFSLFLGDTERGKVSRLLCRKSTIF